MGVAVRTYTLHCDAEHTDPPGGVKITMTAPPEWTESTDGGTIRFAVPAVGGRGPQLALVRCHGDDDSARLAWVLANQVGSDLPGAVRTERSGGRVWIVHQRPTGHVLARLYVPAPAVGGVVSVSLRLGPQHSAHLAEIEPVLETVRVVS